MHIKTVRVTNPSNVLIQIPGFISKNWGLTVGDGLEVRVENDGEQVIIRPKKTCAGSIIDQEGKRVAGGST